ncbi:MAG: hydantoinase/carbamoylase family amidase [Candidatus Eiseniibacteriota bacterium]
MVPRAGEITASDIVGRLERLARFGADGPGVTRLAYDDAWCGAHRWLASEAASLGLAATADWAGNLLLHDPALAPGRTDTPVILIGSHLDSVVRGGRYDGAYGTIAGLLIAAAHRGRPGLPVVGFVTCEEEDSRFHGGLMGGRSLLGRVGEGELDAVVDRGGVTWRQALAAVRERGCAAGAGPQGTAAPPAFRPALQLELHIEQGPVLEAQRLGLGIVERIAGYRRWIARIEGESRHSGTTPMAMRHDTLAAASEMILAAERVGREAGDPAVATAGFVRPEPGLFNVVPGSCELWLEVRHDRLEALDRLAAEVARCCWDVAQRRGLHLALEEGAGQTPTPLSSALAETAVRLAQELEITHRRMPSGAAHDTMIFAQTGIPALLVFVPSRAGVSHSPDEFTSEPELLAGVRFMDALCGRLAVHRPP